MTIIALMQRAMRKILRFFGYSLIRIHPQQNIHEIKGQDITLCEILACPKKAHYGCGSLLLKGWLNIDIAEKAWIPSDAKQELTYVKFDLTKRHPFQTNFFEFEFAQDFLEHLNQNDSIVFLSECYRTLRRGGILRLSFPGLEDVLHRHCKLRDEEGTLFLENMHKAYTVWGHKHFYSKEELTLVCHSVGFEKIQFVEYGKSSHPELCSLDTRENQQDINIYVELTK